MIFFYLISYAFFTLFYSKLSNFSFINLNHFMIYLHFNIYFGIVAITFNYFIDCFIVPLIFLIVFMIGYVNFTTIRYVMAIKPTLI